MGPPFGILPFEEIGTETSESVLDFRKIGTELPIRPEEDYLILVRALLALGDPALLRSIKKSLPTRGVHAVALDEPRDLLNALPREPFDVILLHLQHIPAPVEQTLEAIHKAAGSPDVVVLNDREDSEERSRLLSAGATVVLNRTTDPVSLRDAIAAVIARRQRRPRAPGDPEPTFKDIVASSPQMRKIIEDLRLMADSTASVLILGETGVGKGFMARAIHHESPRKDGPFVALNCGAVPMELAESELFGHVAGAFTGAVRTKRGAFELAHGGTLFLDEIADMPPAMQVKLLSALEEHRFRALGGERSIHVDVRIMAATNRDPVREVRRRRLRRDLYYRINKFTLTIPPLRNRPQDAEEFIRLFFDSFKRKPGRVVTDLAPETLDALIRHTWPGNVRELMNVMERMVLLCRDTELTPDHLPPDIAPSSSGAASPAAEKGKRTPRGSYRASRARALDDHDRQYFISLLRECNGRIGQASQRAGMTPRALFAKMRKLDLRKEMFRMEE